MSIKAHLQMYLIVTPLGSDSTKNTLVDQDGRWLRVMYIATQQDHHGHDHLWSTGREDAKVFTLEDAAALVLRLANEDLALRIIPAARLVGGEG